MTRPTTPTPAYPLSCPICGAQLEPVRGGTPDTAPWLCSADRRGWWPPELTAQARALFDPVTRSYASGPATTAVFDRVYADRAGARERRTSTLPEHGQG